MSDLYLIFFAVGLVIFACIVAYSILQKRRYKPVKKENYVDPLFAELEESKSNATRSPTEKELGDKDRVENKPDDTSANEIDQSHRQEQQIEPTLIDQNQVVDAVVEQNTSDKNDKKRAPLLDANEAKSEPVSATIHQAQMAAKPKVDKDSSSVVTDLVARIKNPDPIEQQGLLSLFRKHDFKFHRKVHIYGLNQLTDMWRDIEFELPSARFTELGVSIQLADRDGAMSQKELHDFQQMVLEFTNFYDAPFEFSMEIDDALKQAIALDQIGRRYDSMAVLNVVSKSKSGFRMADIESCARDLMMSTDKNGIFMKTLGTKNNISVLFRLACTDGSGQFGISSGSTAPVHDLVVYMNVPATTDPEMVFQEMVKDANSLATWLEGKVVDRNGRVMTQRSYSMLMQQVSDITFSMQQDGLVPGDSVAKKLF